MRSYFSPSHACYDPEKVQYATFTQQKPEYAALCSLKNSLITPK